MKGEEVLDEGFVVDYIETKSQASTLTSFFLFLFLLFNLFEGNKGKKKTW